jgi:hypothetical protein
MREVGVSLFGVLHDVMIHVSSVQYMRTCFAPFQQFRDSLWVILVIVVLFCLRQWRRQRWPQLRHSGRTATSSSWTAKAWRT